MSVIMTFSLKLRDSFVGEEQLGSMAKTVAKQLDRDYLEGALYVVCNGKVMLDEKDWDLVDQLLCYIVNDLKATIGGRYFETYFPDQPLRLSIAARHDKVTFIVGDKKTVVDRREFFVALYHLCRRFFDFMMMIYPSGWDAPYVKALKHIARAYPWLSASAADPGSASPRNDQATRSKIHAIPPKLSRKDPNLRKRYRCPLCNGQRTTDKADTGRVRCPMIADKAICLGCCIDHQAVARARDFAQHPYYDLFQHITNVGSHSIRELRLICLNHQESVLYQIGTQPKTQQEKLLLEEIARAKRDNI